MEAPLTPELALAYLRELSLDVISAVVLDGRGGRLAGAPELAEPARALLEVPEAALGLAVRTRAGWVFGARAHTVGIAVTTGPLALAGLMRHDVAEVVGLLGARLAGSGTGRPEMTSPRRLEALGEAVHGASSPVATLSSTDR